MNVTNVCVLVFFVWDTDIFIIFRIGTLHYSTCSTCCVKIIQQEFSCSLIKVTFVMKVNLLYFFAALPSNTKNC